MEYKDYYAVLGVKKTADAGEIRQAYRQLARQHHPDLHPEKNKAAAAEKFKEINEANEVLSDPAKRAKYDEIGPGWESAQERQESRPRESSSHHFSSGGGEDFAGFSNFFEELFGDAGRQGFDVPDATRGGTAQGQDVEADMPLPLEDAFHGGEKRISIMVPVLCPACGGTGRKGRSVCSDCGGVGEIRKERSITAHLPKYVRDGTKLRLRGQGGAGPSGKTGDLFLRVRLLPHPAYKVSGSDIETSVTVMPWIAALGGEAVVPALDGPVRIRVPSGTRAGKPFRIPGKGLAKEAGSRGNLYAVVRIDNPAKLTSRMQRLYQELKEADQ